MRSRQRKGTSLTEEVHSRLRFQIVTGERTPGARLRLKDLASEFGVSTSVIREAVSRLASEELVVATPQLGFRVRPLSVDDLRDLCWNRIYIESVAVRESVLKGDDAWRDRVNEAHDVVSTTPVDDATGAVSLTWLEAHNRFHAVLAEACGSPVLLRMRQRIYDAGEIYRHWAKRVRADSLETVGNEHGALCAAALARDGAAAERLTAAHVQRAVDALLRLINSEPPLASFTFPQDDGLTHQEVGVEPKLDYAGEVLRLPEVAS